MREKGGKKYFKKKKTKKKEKKKERKEKKKRSGLCAGEKLKPGKGNKPARIGAVSRACLLGVIVSRAKR